MKSVKTAVKFRIWLYKNEAKILGKGRVELLEHIAQTGSITNAAKQMKMSYRQAWQMVQDMNQNASTPLVEKKLGGKEGGGARLTSAGVKAIKEFHNLEKKVQRFILAESKKIAI